MSEEQTSGKQQDNNHLSDVIGISPKEKWENLKRYIIEQTDKIDKETEWQPTEPEWWLEMSAVVQTVRRYYS